jgi:hypothetical protein
MSRTADNLRGVGNGRHRTMSVRPARTIAGAGGARPTTNHAGRRCAEDVADQGSFRSGWTRLGAEETSDRR